MLQILPGWMPRIPIDPNPQGPDQWQWRLPITPPDSPHAFWITLTVQRMTPMRTYNPTTWEWIVTEEQEAPRWIGTGFPTKLQAVTHACSNLHHQFGTPLEVIINPPSPTP